MNRRCVTFGKQLSPEVFDYRRPPATPIRRGATPRPKDGTGKRQSILKMTPLKYVREETDFANFSLNAFNLSPTQSTPSPEKKPISPSIERVEPANATPTTPERPTGKH